jgi:hypothetical protein
MGPRGETISDLVAWTRRNWSDLVLKPERGYSGIGVKVGGVDRDSDAAVEMALAQGRYIVQEKIPLELWAEMLPELNHEHGVTLKQRQTDFRCLIGPETIFGFLGRFGDVPTNVGSGGGVHPLAILKKGNDVQGAVKHINDAILRTPPHQVEELIALQEDLARQHNFTYLLGPIKIALRPRVIAPSQLTALTLYCNAVWQDCLQLEKMWLSGELDEWIDIEEEELAIARSQPWQGGPAIFAADGLFSFGAHLEHP